jgi:hypothetical protein
MPRAHFISMVNLDMAHRSACIPQPPRPYPFGLTPTPMPLPHPTPPPRFHARLAPPAVPSRCAQLGPATNLRLRALLDLAEQIIFEPCYDVLRTKQQVGARDGQMWAGTWLNAMHGRQERVREGPLVHAAAGGAWVSGASFRGPAPSAAPRTSQALTHPSHPHPRGTSPHQLGYTVHSGTRLTHGVLGFCVVVVSAAYGPLYVEGRVEAFLAAFRDVLQVGGLGVGGGDWLGWNGMAWTRACVQGRVQGWGLGAQRRARRTQPPTLPLRPLAPPSSVHPGHAGRGV